MNKRLRFSLFIVLLCIVLSCCGCNGSKTEEPVTSINPLDLVLTAEEQEQFSEYIDSVDYEFYPMWSNVYYHGICDSVDKVSEIGLKGAPVLIAKSVEIEKEESAKYRERAQGFGLANYWTFTASSVFRIEYDFLIKANDWVVMPSKNYRAFWNYVKEELPKIAASEEIDENKITAYRKFGVFAVPYVVKEIEKGNAEYETFFAFMGAHLSTSEYMRIVNSAQLVPLDTRPPSKEEIEAELVGGYKESDYKAWLDENEEDLNALFLFFDEFTKEE